MISKEKGRFVTEILKLRKIKRIDLILELFFIIKEIFVGNCFTSFVTV